MIKILLNYKMTKSAKLMVFLDIGLPLNYFFTASKLLIVPLGGGGVGF